MLRLLLLFIAVPIIELFLLIEIGRRIGTLWTLALIVVTGLVGAALARRQGLRVLAEVRANLEQGRLPAGSLMDGVMILLAAAVLMTPGVLTDALGFAFLVPGVRRWAKGNLRRRFERKIRDGRVSVVVDVAGYRPIPSDDGEYSAAGPTLELPEGHERGDS